MIEGINIPIIMTAGAGGWDCESLNLAMAIRAGNIQMAIVELPV